MMRYLTGGVLTPQSSQKKKMSQLLKSLREGTNSMTPGGYQVTLRKKRRSLNLQPSVSTPTMRGGRPRRTSRTRGREMLSKERSIRYWISNSASPTQLTNCPQCIKDTIPCSTIKLIAQIRVNALSTSRSETLMHHLFLKAITNQLRAILSPQLIKVSHNP